MATATGFGVSRPGPDGILEEEEELEAVKGKGKGRASVLRDYAEALAEETDGSLAQRDYIRTTNGTSVARMDVMVAEKDVYSASRAALLDMALIRSDGYDGDVNMLDADVDSLEMSDEQESRFREDLYAIRAAPKRTKPLPPPPKMMCC